MGQRIDDLGTFRSSAMPLQSLLTYRVSSLNARMNRQASDILRVHGNLKLPEWRILEVLGLYGELTGTRIVSLSGLDAGLVSRTMQSLEKRGLVTLRRSSADRRVIHAQPTDSGLAMVEVIFPIMQSRQKSLIDALDWTSRRQSSTSCQSWTRLPAIVCPALVTHPSCPQIGHQTAKAKTTLAWYDPLTPCVLGY